MVAFKSINVEAKASAPRQVRSSRKAEGVQSDGFGVSLRALLTAATDIPIDQGSRSVTGAELKRAQSEVGQSSTDEGQESTEGEQTVLPLRQSAMVIRVGQTLPGHLTETLSQLELVGSRSRPDKSRRQPACDGAPPSAIRFVESGLELLKGGSASPTDAQPLQKGAMGALGEAKPVSSPRLGQRRPCITIGKGISRREVFGPGDPVALSLGGVVNPETSVDSSSLEVARRLETAIFVVPQGVSALSEYMTVSSKGEQSVSPTGWIEHSAGESRGDLAGNSKTASDAEAFRVLTVTASSLEVEIPNDAQGFLRIRAQLGGSGSITASLVSDNQKLADSLHRELTAISTYLKDEQVGIASISLSSMAAIADLGQSGTGSSGAPSAGAAGRGPDRPPQENVANQRKNLRVIELGDDGVLSESGVGELLLPLSLRRGSGGWLSVLA